mmetsp:Transcript_12279/g.19992  ORF Transcript_12279/g.19992 Transcript_12279/m.19992 type:complete len:486 (-) Transcript_12279:142-1599(-)
MGAGASATDGYEGNVVEDGTKAVKETVNQVDNGLEAVQDMNVDVNEQLDKLKSSIGASVGEGAQEGVESILESVRGVMSSEQLSRATDEFNSAIPNLEGAAVFASLAASLEAAADMAGPVMANVGAAVLVLGEHLPYIAVAAGAIGAIIHTFKMSKESDDNVKNVSFWMASVRDWLMLVAEKVSSSGAASTIPLFEALQESMMTLNQQMESWRSKWRVTKMLGSVSFERDFNRVKTSVLELKNALRDFLDEETQQRQEKSLGEISSLQVETNEKLTSMDDQLVLIREMLAAQEEARLKHEAAAKEKQEHDSKTEVKEEVERIYQNIQRAAGVESNAPVTFQSFVLVFETFFYAGGDMPSEQRRGLNISVDRDHTKVVTKAAWVKFYKQWTEANIEIEEYLNKIAADNPTLLTATATKAKQLSEQGVEIAKTKLAEVGIESTEDAKHVLAEGMDEAKKKLASGMTKFGFGKKPAEERESEAVTSDQ